MKSRHVRWPVKVNRVIYLAVNIEEVRCHWSRKERM